MGKNPNFLSNLKCKDRQIFDKLYEIKRDIEETNKELEKIYFSLLNTREVATFGRYLCKRGIYKTGRAFGTKMPNFFGTRERMNHSALKRHKEIILLYKEWESEKREH